jgi:hypothetical protein
MERDQWNEEEPLQSRIDNVLLAVANAETPWAEQYWNNVLNALLRKLNRCGPANYMLN